MLRRRNPTISLAYFLATTTSLVTMATPTVHAAPQATEDASSIFANVDLLNRSVDVLLKARQVQAPTPPKHVESGLAPMHVYQLQITCVERLHEFERQSGIHAIPLIVSQPTKYTLSDVQILTYWLLADLRRTASHLNIQGVPQKATKFSSKTSSDVFEKMLEVVFKINALRGKTNLTADELYAEIDRAVTDAKLVLRKIDPACRYRVDVPDTDTAKAPTDIFARCVAVRQTINDIRNILNIDIGPTGLAVDGQQPDLADVFVQTQIILAELNLLKASTGTVYSTLPAVFTVGKASSDVYDQVAMLHYLLAQLAEVGDLAPKAGLAGDSAAEPVEEERRPI